MVKQNEEMINGGKEMGAGAVVGQGVGELMQAGPIGIVIAILIWPVMFVFRKIFRRKSQ